jgi:hypothetical protein
MDADPLGHMRDVTRRIDGLDADREPAAARLGGPQPDDRARAVT